MGFLVIYIREAHPEEGWILPENRRSGIAIHEPTTDGERQTVAATCAAKLELTLPTAIDGIDNAVAAAYGGWPDRLYLVDTDGRIAYQGGEGPFGFLPEELGAAIEAELSGSPRRSPGRRTASG